MGIYLQTFGSRLRVRDGIFELTVPDLSGANHHVVESYAAHEIRCIWLQKGTSLSTDALLLALENDVDILVLDHFGQPQGRLWPNRPSSTLAIWKKQLSLSHSPEGLRIARAWIAEKIQGRILHLRKLKRTRSEEKAGALTAAEQELAEALAKINRVPLHPFDSAAASLRGHEGTAGRIYFEALSDLLPEPYRFDGRSSQPASDAFNAFLNYGYGILYTKAERALLLAGLHPHIGFMHADGYQRKNLVYDFVEQFRVWVDKAVFILFSRKAVTTAHVTPKGEKGVWLAEEGKRLLVALLNERFRHKTIEFNNRQYSQDGYMLECARRCAALLLNSLATCTI